MFSLSGKKIIIDLYIRGSFLQTCESNETLTSGSIQKMWKQILLVLTLELIWFWPGSQTVDVIQMQSYSKMLFSEL